MIFGRAADDFFALVGADHDSSLLWQQRCALLTFVVSVHTLGDRKRKTVAIRRTARQEPEDRVGAQDSADVLPHATVVNGFRGSTRCGVSPMAVILLAELNRCGGLEHQPRMKQEKHREQQSHHHRQCQTKDEEKPMDQRGLLNERSVQRFHSREKYKCNVQ